MSNFIEILVTFTRVRINNIWYLRGNSMYWYMESDIGYESLNFQDCLSIEEEYQCLKQS